MKLLFTGMLGLYNRGCEAIVRGSYETLKRACSNLELGVAVGYPDTARLDHERLRGSGFPACVIPLYRQRPGVLARAVAKVWCRFGREYVPRRRIDYVPGEWDVILEAGGDTFVEGGCKWRIREDNWIRRRTSGAVVLWGLNFDSAFAEYCRRYPAVARALRRYSLIAVRDGRSVEVLKEVGIASNVKRMGDPAFAMAPVVWGLGDGLNGFPRDRLVGLNLSPYACRARSCSIEELCGFGEVLCRQLCARGYSVLLVPHTYSPPCPEGDDDLQVLRRISDRFGGGKIPVRLLETPCSAPEIKYAISQCTVFAGARMHSTIAAWSSGVPAVSLSYSEKSAVINDEIYGHRDYLVSVATASPNDVASIIERAVEDQVSLRCASLRYTERVNGLSEAAAGALAELCGNGGSEHSG